PTLSPALGATQLQIKEIGPEIRAGEPFNVQPSASSAMWVVTNINAPKDSVVVVDGRELDTVAGGSTTVSAAVPLDLIKSAGPKQVWIRYMGARGIENTPPFVLDVK